jgi:hypothetical protein
MSTPQALIEFFQKEATEYLDRLDQLLAVGDAAPPDAAALLTNARALRGSATMTRLEGLPDLASTVERIATGLRDNALRWDQRLHFAVRGAMVELRALIERATLWNENDTRRCQTRSVALAAVAAAYLATTAPADSPAMQVMPVARYFPDDGAPGVVQRDPHPPITLAQRFRVDVAAAAGGVAREARSLSTSTPGPAQLALADGVRRALVGLADVAESYGAASIRSLATRMSRAQLAAPWETAAVQSFAQLLMDRELTDSSLAQRVRQANATWGAPAIAEPSIVPIESLLYRGKSAITRARTVRDELSTHWQHGTLADPAAHALFEELSDLLDLAVTT